MPFAIAHTDPARNDTRFALPDWVQAQIQSLQSELAKRDAELKRRALINKPAGNMVL